MEVLSQRKPSSSLNPNAPSFVPLAYREVEDFSEEWWALIHSSPSFHDYWLQQRYQDQDHDDADIFSDEPLLPEDEDSLFNDVFLTENYDDLIYDNSGNEEIDQGYYYMDLIATEEKAHYVTVMPRYGETATKPVEAR